MPVASPMLGTVLAYEQYYTYHESDQYQQYLLQHVVAAVTPLIPQYGSFNKINCVYLRIGAVDFMLKQKAVVNTFQQ